MKTVLYFCVLCIAFASCHTARHASKDAALQSIDTHNFQLLKGTYHNQPINDQLHKSYASTYDVNVLTDVQLAKQFFLLDENWNTNADKIELLPTNNELQVTAFFQDKTVSQHRVKGKFRRGYFKTKKESKTGFPPIPPFYYFNENVRLYITVDKENNLVVKRRGKKTGMIFFFASGFKMDNEYHYAPISLIDSVIKGNDNINSISKETENTKPKLSGDAAIDKKLQPIIDKITRIMAAGEQYEKVTKDLETGGEGGKATFYSKEDAVVLIEKVQYGETFRKEMDYYFDDGTGNLMYMTERHYRYNRPIYYDEKAAKENNDTEAFDESKSTILTHHSYFENEKLFYRSNSTGEPEDKQQWERIGKEVLNELEEIYK